MKLACLFLLACACSSADTFPPPISDCDSCKTPIIIGTGGGGDASSDASDASIKDTSTNDVDDATAIDSADDVVDTGTGG